MSNISPADRKEAKATIRNFYAEKMPNVPDRSEVCDFEVEKLTKKHHKLIQDITDLKAKLDAAEIKLENKLPTNFCLNRDKIEVSHGKVVSVAKSAISEAKKKQKPYFDQQSVSLTILQTIITREELKVLFQQIGIIG